MKSFSKWSVAVVAVVLMAGTAKAADAIVGGEVKAINADKKEFVMHSDATGKDVTVKLGNHVVINRGGKEGNSDLKVGDTVNVCHDNGTLTWTAHYILVRTGDTKDCVLRHGTVKSYAPDTKKLQYTDANGKDAAFAMGDAKVRLNKEESKIADVKIGDKFLIIVEMPKGEKETLKCLMIDRK
jgi:hypothetical protein